MTKDETAMQSAKCKVQIGAEAIDVGRVYDELGDFGSGAVVLFVGRVRETNEGRDVTGITYEAYAAMAEAECERLVREAIAQWPVRRAVLRHRVGPLAVGEISVAAGVAAGHRDDAFAAARFLIDALKARVPIWKQEVYRDGARAWTANTPSSSNTP